MYSNPVVSGFCPGDSALYILIAVQVFDVVYWFKETEGSHRIEDVERRRY
jgi:hypothetical protein